MAKTKNKTSDKKMTFSKDEYEVVFDYPTNTFTLVSVKHDKVLSAVSYLIKNYSQLKKKFDKFHEAVGDGIPFTVSVPVQYAMFVWDGEVKWNKEQKLKTFIDLDYVSLDLDRNPAMNMVKSSAECKEAEAKMNKLRDDIVDAVQDLLSKDKETKHDLSPKQLNAVINKVIETESVRKFYL